jgi:chromosome segregation ATPase
MARIERESINFKLPKTLCDELRTAAAKRDTTATELVIQGLHHILGDVPGVEGSVEVRLYQLEEEFFRLKSSHQEGNINTHHETRLASVESKLEELSNKLARFEGALNAVAASINASKSRRSGGYSPYNQHNPQPAQLEPRNEKQLAVRLNSNVATIQEKRATYTPQEFDRWCRDRDGTQHAWHFNEKDGLYHPVK